MTASRSHTHFKHQWPNLKAMLHETANANLARKAFTTLLPNGFRTTMTFAEVERLSDAFAAYLRLQLNLQKGDRVAVKLPNCQTWPVVAFGILKSGCVLVNVNPLYTEHELAHILKDSGSKVLVVLDLFLGKLDQAIPGSQVQTVVSASLGDFFPLHTSLLIRTSLLLKKQLGRTSVPTVTISSALDSGKKHFDSVAPYTRGHWGWKASKSPDNSIDLTLNDLAVLQYTGGTTGVSKAAMLTHGNIIANVQQVLDAGKSRLQPGLEVILTALPLYHIFAFTVNGLCFFQMGAHSILVPSPRPISNLRAAFQRYEFTWITGVNTMFSALTREQWFKEQPLRRLKVVIAGGMALHKKTAEDWKSVTGIPIIEGYGLTEASPVVTINPVDGEGRVGSIGLRLMHTDIRYVDENDRPVMGDTPGELLVRGPQVMFGYWNQPSETAAVLKDGWLKTGDLGYEDSEGYVYLVDRKKDMILVSGFNVYPNEVEDVLTQHPDVSEAAVIGVPDDVTGEQIHAYIVRKNWELTEETLREHCRNYLTRYKIPKTFIFCTELPKSNVGKVLRREVRDMAIAAIEKRKQ